MWSTEVDHCVIKPSSVVVDKTLRLLRRSHGKSQLHKHTRTHTNTHKFTPTRGYWHKTGDTQTKARIRAVCSSCELSGCDLFPFAQTLGQRKRSAAPRWCQNAHHIICISYWRNQRGFRSCWKGDWPNGHIWPSAPFRAVADYASGCLSTVIAVHKRWWSSSTNSNPSQSNTHTCPLEGQRRQIKCCAEREEGYQHTAPCHPETTVLKLRYQHVSDHLNITRNDANQSVREV